MSFDWFSQPLSPPSPGLQWASAQGTSGPPALVSINQYHQHNDAYQSPAPHHRHGHHRQSSHGLIDPASLSGTGSSQMPPMGGWSDRCATAPVSFPIPLPVPAPASNVPSPSHSQSQYSTSYHSPSIVYSGGVPLWSSGQSINSLDSIDSLSACKISSTPPINHSHNRSNHSVKTSMSMSSTRSMVHSMGTVNLGNTESGNGSGLGINIAAHSANQLHIAPTSVGGSMNYSSHHIQSPSSAAKRKTADLPSPYTPKRQQSSQSFTFDAEAAEADTNTDSDLSKRIKSEGSGGLISARFATPSPRPSRSRGGSQTISRGHALQAPSSGSPINHSHNESPPSLSKTMSAVPVLPPTSMSRSSSSPALPANGRQLPQLQLQSQAQGFVAPSTPKTPSHRRSQSGHHRRTTSMGSVSTVPSLHDIPDDSTIPATASLKSEPVEKLQRSPTEPKQKDVKKDCKKSKTGKKDGKGSEHDNDSSATIDITELTEEEIRAASLDNAYLLASQTLIFDRTGEVMRRDHIRQRHVAALMGISCSTLSPMLKGKYKHTKTKHVEALRNWCYQRDVKLWRKVAYFADEQTLNEESLAKRCGMNLFYFKQWLMFTLPLKYRLPFDQTLIEWMRQLQSKLAHSGDDESLAVMEKHKAAIAAIEGEESRSLPDGSDDEHTDADNGNDLHNDDDAVVMSEADTRAMKNKSRINKERQSRAAAVVSSASNGDLRPYDSEGDVNQSFSDGDEGDDGRDSAVHDNPLAYSDTGTSSDYELPVITLEDTDTLFGLHQSFTTIAHTKPVQDAQSPLTGHVDTVDAVTGRGHGTNTDMETALLSKAPNVHTMPPLRQFSSARSTFSASTASTESSGSRDSSSPAVGNIGDSDISRLSTTPIPIVALKADDTNIGLLSVSLPSNPYDFVGVRSGTLSQLSEQDRLFQAQQELIQTQAAQLEILARMCAKSTGTDLTGLLASLMTAPSEANTVIPLAVYSKEQASRFASMHTDIKDRLTSTAAAVLSSQHGNEVQIAKAVTVLAQAEAQAQVKRLLGFDLLSAEDQQVLKELEQSTMTMLDSHTTGIDADCDNDTINPSDSQADALFTTPSINRHSSSHSLSSSVVRSVDSGGASYASTPSAGSPSQSFSQSNLAKFSADNRPLTMSSATAAAAASMTDIDCEDLNDEDFPDDACDSSLLQSLELHSTHSQQSHLYDPLHSLRSPIGSHSSASLSPLGPGHCTELEHDFLAADTEWNTVADTTTDDVSSVSESKQSYTPTGEQMPIAAFAKH